MGDPTPRRLIREALTSATWIGFDLDDTLHDFRGASSTAIQDVFEIVRKQANNRISIEDMRFEYKDILRSKTAGAFTDGKTSHEYRAERFAALLSRFQIPVEDELVSHLVAEYERSLSSSLRLKEGASDLLGLVREKGKKIMVITEGPQDAQERTAKQLLDGKIDALVTTNKLGVAKIDGLFSEVLKQFNLLPTQMVYVGDSLERDIIPATRAGIFAVHFGEGLSTGKAGLSAKSSIDKLSDLKAVLEALD